MFDSLFSSLANYYLRLCFQGDLQLADYFKEQMQPIASKIPFMTCPGNHERFPDTCPGNHERAPDTCPGNHERFPDPGGLFH